VNDETISERRAIEALRAGVPNGDAVRALGSSQQEIIDAFDGQLSNAAEITARGATGFVFSGTFGSGKSHLVEELHQRALASNFVSSKVSISKETPLHLPARVVQSVIGAMQAKDKPEGLLLDMILSYKSDRPAARDLTKWCGSAASGVSVTFGTLLELRDAGIEDLEIIDLVLRYFSCENVLISTLRRRVVEYGVTSPAEAVLAIDRPWQTVRFLSRFCQVNGYRGWVIFLDETELISKYGPISRARAYEQLGRWLGLRTDHRVSGTAVVATVIDDFAFAVLGSQGDRWLMPEKLASSNRPADIAGVPFAADAIGAIDAALHLKQMTDAQIRKAHSILREAHSRAYGWEAPELEIDFRSQNPMRLYVRRWINEWDLRRLYGRESHLQFEDEDLTVRLEEEDGAYEVPEWDNSTD
jgi:hypothetical protein